MSTYARCVARCSKQWRGRVPIRMVNRWIGGYACHEWIEPRSATPDDFPHDLVGGDDE